uniref:hypothetical protein n=1 Tax=Mesorhizobium sp. 113-3-3 TaxID=2744516 RepID=UPI001926F6EF|nr:hypothetical protein [Mesorhizobium sp. 113-3-3]
MSALVQHDYRCAGFGISNRSHPLNADIAVDTYVEENRSCGFLRGVSHAITERLVHALAIAE